MTKTNGSSRKQNGQKCQVMTDLVLCFWCVGAVVCRVHDCVCLCECVYVCLQCCVELRTTEHHFGVHLLERSWSIHHIIIMLQNNSLWQITSTIGNLVEQQQQQQQQQHQKKKSKIVTESRASISELHNVVISYTVHTIFIMVFPFIIPATISFRVKAFLRAFSRLWDSFFSIVIVSCLSGRRMNLYA